MEPVQDLVRILLEHDGYVVRCNTRYKVPFGYSDIDISAIEIDPATGAVQDRICGEVKAHLEHSLTPGYLLGFISNFATLLDLAKLDLTRSGRARLKARQEAEDQRASEILGPRYRRVLFHAGPKPVDGGAGARELLREGVEVR